MYYQFINVIFSFACVIGEVTHAHTMCKNPCACQHVHVLCTCFFEGGDGPNTGKFYTNTGWTRDLYRFGRAVFSAMF